MDNTLLALLGFALGILTTVVTQAILRRWKLADARQRRKLEGLQSVMEWMKVYLTVLECQYPNMPELVMPDSYVKFGVEPFDATAFVRLVQTHKNYRSLQSELIKAEKNARAALYSLAKANKKAGLLDRIKFRNKFFGRVGTRLRSYEIPYTPGFTRDIAPYLEKLFELEYKIYEEFPNEYVKVKWEKLEYTDIQDIRSIIYVQNANLENRNFNAQLGIDRISSYKQEAEKVIEQILEIIQEYESKWLVPKE